MQRRQAALRWAPGVEVDRVLPAPISNASARRRERKGRTPTMDRTWKLRCSGFSPLVATELHSSVRVSNDQRSSALGEKTPMSFPPHPPQR